MFNGSITALVTPMSEDGSLDLESLEQLIDWQVESDTSGLVIAGTTGESASLSATEFEELLTTAVSRAAGRIAIIAGTGSPDTRKAARQTRIAARLGADAALVVTPYYNRPPQSGLLAHYRHVAAAAELPIIMYNVPARTGVDLLPGTAAELARIENIVAIKEACTEPGRISELITLCGGDCTVLSGDDPSCMTAIADGARGVVSVAANVAPAQMAELCSLAGSGQSDRAGQLNSELAPLYAALALETNPIPVKYALATMGLIQNRIRLPLTTLAARYRLELAAALKPIELKV